MHRIIIENQHFRVTGLHCILPKLEVSPQDKHEGNGRQKK
jgi:hypothetical protein